MNERINNNPDIKHSISLVEKKMDELSRPILVAIDGRSGSGKSTIAKAIARKLNGKEIISDDFWTGGSNEDWDKKSPKEKAEQAIDWKRLRKEALEPLLSGDSASWHPFNWEKGSGTSPKPIESEATNLIILDGAYSTRPELSDIIDINILVETPNDAKRRGRLVEREGKEYMEDWHSRWDVAEDYYFSKVRPKESFDLVISNS